MKMSKVAKMIGVDRRTIYNWIEHPQLSEHFSAGAKKEGDRELEEADIFVANTVNYLRKNVTTDWGEIADRLKEGYRITDLPLESLSVDTGKTPLQQFTKSLTLSQERDKALAELTATRKELELLKSRHEDELEQVKASYESRLQQEREQARAERAELQSSAKQDLERLLREIAELNYKLGKLEAQKPPEPPEHPDEG